MTTEEFRLIAPSLPMQAGIYKYYNQQNEIIYVGKAKNLRKRVSSYFNKIFNGYKTHELVKNIHHIEFTVVNSEQDAFFLENSLIKEFRPRYNISLKDDKTYPYIVIKNEPFPRVFFTRTKIDDGSEYLGPFTSVGMVRDLLEFIKQHIPLRTCTLNLTEKNIAAGKFKVCLEYHLGNCKGPCEGLQSLQDYQEGIIKLKQILKGHVGDVMRQYKQQMKQYVEQMEFEKAELVKRKIEHLENYTSKSVIVSHSIGDVDVFTILKEDDTAFVNYLMVRNGTIVQTHNVPFHPKLDETDAEILSFGIAQIRTIFNSDVPEIVVPFEIEYVEPSVMVTVSRGGDKKKLLDLSFKNVMLFSEDVKRRKLLHAQQKADEQILNVLERIQKDLQLAELPTHIECFDNSNFQGSFPVSAMVCFKNGKPSKSDYRLFNVKTVEGINDFSTMEEVVFRRYKRLKEENLPLPQLVIIDGGKGQLHAAMNSIQKLELTGKMTVIGLAKREEEIFFPGDSEPIHLDYNGESLKLIRRIRDEVHRFGITFHRNKRSKGTFKNELENIKGIGDTTVTALLKHFKSVKNIKAASLKDIENVIGKSKSMLVRNYFQQLK